MYTLINAHLHDNIGTMIVYECVYMYVCMYVCVCIYVCMICMYVCMYVCIELGDIPVLSLHRDKKLILPFFSENCWGR